MQVMVIPEVAGVELRDADDCGDFRVCIVGGADGDAGGGGAGGAAHLDDLLGSIGRPDGDHVWVSVEVVRRMAAGRVDDGWDERFASMLEYAASKGWLDADGAHVRAHVERVAE